MSQYIQVVTTAETKEDADSIAETVVRQRLAACAQVLGPIRSTYWWKEKIETSEEWLCQMKSREGLFPALEKAILEVHPYEVPEILALPVLTGHQPYLQWMDEEMKKKI